MPELTHREASAIALAEEMRRDDRVWALGEDLGRGGIFGQYKGLQQEFGPSRIVDTPISESAIMGVAVGAALLGTRPVAEMRFADFGLCASDELVNQAAKYRFMFGGQARVPLVVRQPFGMGRSAGAQHSQCLESWYVHVPGLVVLAPATPADNYGLLKAAIRCGDPVVFLEHKGLWAVPGEVTLQEEPAPIGTASVLREGQDVTIVAWSAMTYVACEAAEYLAADGISAEIINLGSLWPWDQRVVIDSAARSGRLLVVHEAVRVSGFGAEIVSTVVESISVQVRRLAPPRVPIPYSPKLEDQLRVSEGRIVEVVKEMMS